MHKWKRKEKANGLLLTEETPAKKKKADWTKKKAVALLMDYFKAIPQNLIDSLFSHGPGPFCDPSRRLSLVHLFCMSLKHAPAFLHAIPHSSQLTGWHRLTTSARNTSLCKTCISWKKLAESNSLTMGAMCKEGLMLPFQNLHKM